LFDDRRRWKTDDDEGNDDDGDDHGGKLLESTQSTDDGFAEDILESSDVLIKNKLLSLSKVICWSCSDFRPNAVG
jgi:hypothetical protein